MGFAGITDFWSDQDDKGVISHWPRYIRWYWNGWKQTSSTCLCWSGQLQAAHEEDSLKQLDERMSGRGFLASDNLKHTSDGAKDDQVVEIQRRQ
jgi:hypothetical protein